MSDPPIYKSAAPLDPAAWGLDPRTFELTLTVNRIDFEAMTDEERAAAAAALARGAVPAKGTGGE